MKLVVISPEGASPREPEVLASLFAAGLERYHVRKPDWTEAALARWLTALPEAWRPRLVLHQHHGLVQTLGLGGRHWQDRGGKDVPPVVLSDHGRGDTPTFTSRSCHDLPTLTAALGSYDSVFLGAVFPSISKPGYGPRQDFTTPEFAALLAGRASNVRRTAVLALGGITAENAPRCRELGFDGVAVLGTVWSAPDPVRAFAQLQTALQRHAS